MKINNLTVKQYLDTNYYADSSGGIWSGNYEKMKSLTPKKSKTGGLSVTMFINERKTSVAVDRVIATVFVLNHKPETNKFILHKNGLKFDNRAENLRWVNYNDLYNHFNAKPNKSSFNKKLTERDVILIRKDQRTHKEIATQYEVSVTTISKILSYKTWKHVK